MAETSIFRTVHHICIIVRDIERSVAFYDSVGIGPWTKFPSLESFKLDVPDRDAFLDLQFRFANLENVQLQLCQPGKGDTPQRRFLETRGEGVFQIGFNVADSDEAEEKAKAVGVDVKMRGRAPNGSGFTYFNTDDQAGVVLQVRSMKIT